MAREYPAAPLIGVGAIVFDAEGAVLLIRRATEPLKGHLSLPGGLVELGETMAEATVREMREETGLTIEVVALAGLFDRIYKEGDRVRYHYVVGDYLCRVIAGTARPASDASEVVWMGFEDWSGAESGLEEPTVEAIRLAYQLKQGMERDTGIEPAIFSLGS